MSGMRYLPVVMLQVDKDGNPVGLTVNSDGDIEIADGFARYGIVDRKRKNRVCFSTKCPVNNQTKLMSMMGMGEDDFDRDEFERKMQEKSIETKSEEEELAATS